jgi:hypothetical protein
MFNTKYVIPEILCHLFFNTFSLRRCFLALLVYQIICDPPTGKWHWYGVAVVENIAVAGNDPRHMPRLPLAGACTDNGRIQFKVLPTLRSTIIASVHCTRWWDA